MGYPVGRTLLEAPSVMELCLWSGHVLAVTIAGSGARVCRIMFHLCHLLAV